MSYTLTINWTAPSPAPANGYRVKYWNVNSPETVITVSPNFTSSPAVISLATSGCYAGTVEAVCGPTEFSAPVNFSACIAGDCLTGDTTATANCGQSDLATFTLGVGHYATVQMTGFYYSGTGTRTITGSLLDNANNIIQNFTYTQTGSSPGTTVPASYQISEPGIYKLQVNTINCSNGSGTATMTVGNCQVIPPPTYYYYNVSKYDCNNSCATVSGSFVARSSTSGLTSASGYYRVGDYSYQITSTASAGSFSVDLDGATSSPTCNDACDIVGEFGCECYNVLGEAVSVSYYTCNTNTLATATFNNGDTIAVYPGTTPTLLSGSGSLIGPFGCIS